MCVALSKLHLGPHICCENTGGQLLCAYPDKAIQIMTTPVPVPVTPRSLVIALDTLLEYGDNSCNHDVFCDFFERLNCSSELTRYDRQSVYTFILRLYEPICDFLCERKTEMLTLPQLVHRQLRLGYFETSDTSNKSFTDVQFDPIHRNDPGIDRISGILSFVDYICDVLTSEGSITYMKKLMASGPVRRVNAAFINELSRLVGSWLHSPMVGRIKRVLDLTKCTWKPIVDPNREIGDIERLYFDPSAVPSVDMFIDRDQCYLPTTVILNYINSDAPIDRAIFGAMVYHAYVGGSISFFNHQVHMAVVRHIPAMLRSMLPQSGAILLSSDEIIRPLIETNNLTMLIQVIDVLRCYPTSDIYLELASCFVANTSDIPLWDANPNENLVCFVNELILHGIYPDARVTYSVDLIKKLPQLNAMATQAWTRNPTYNGKK